MRTFRYEEIDNNLYTREVVKLLTMIHEYRARQDAYMASCHDMLDALSDVSKTLSVGASNRIEGISASTRSLKEIVQGNAKPQNPSEQQLAGYRDAMNNILSNYADTVPRADFIRQLHHTVFVHTSVPGGHYKSADNVIEEQDSDGNWRVRFSPIPAHQVEDAMDRLCTELTCSLNQKNVDPLLVIPVFILDFLCIHPFSDGNGRLSRLLTGLLLYQEYYDVGKHISLDAIIEKTLPEYYDSLQRSSWGWHEGVNDYMPFVLYFLRTVAVAYKELTYRIETVTKAGLNKSERIKHLFNIRVGKVTKSDISGYCPDISVTTIEKVLYDLQNKGFIQKVGGGRSTAYVITEMYKMM